MRTTRIANIASIVEKQINCLQRKSYETYPEGYVFIADVTYCASVRWVFENENLIEMRNTKFRGKYSPRHEWVYGDYFNNHDIGANQDIIINHDEHNGTGQEFIVSAGSIGMFTGFHDKNGKEIYEGDVLSDWNEVDGKMMQSKMQVFWCEKVGAWKLDNSYSQDKSSGDLLSDELAGFAYEVTGDVYSGALEKEAL